VKFGPRRLFAVGVSTALVAAGATAAGLTLTTGVAAAEAHANFVFHKTEEAPTATPIKHVVIIFDENVSFDHYFGTYPDATNTDGEPFYAAPGTPQVNGLTANAANGDMNLLTDNPNATQPQRLDPGTDNSNSDDILTCDQDHDYTPEQYAFDGGKMDRFESSLGTATASGLNPEGTANCQAGTVMDYYDGNTVTAEWNYAQHFAMSDNNFGSEFGPSTVGAIDVVSGDTGGVDVNHAVRGVLTDGDVVSYTLSNGGTGYTDLSDAQPYWDDCSTGAALALTGENVGDQLNSKDLSWGWFQGGFTPTTPYSGPLQTATTYDQLDNPNKVTCTSSHPIGEAIGGTGASGAHAWGTESDYSAHFDGFAFYASTANPHHIAPVSLSVVGTDTATPGEFDTANHNYDVTWFNGMVAAIHDGTEPPSDFPAVSYLKAPAYETGHPGYSDPIDEQNWIVNEVNSIEQLPTWKSTAIFITYDDSDGWYDHVYSGVTNPSITSADTLTGTAPAGQTYTGMCGTETGNEVNTLTATQSTVPLYNQQGRCGYGPRLPLIAISPWAKQNFVESQYETSQSSLIAFIEYNWGLGEIPGSFANVPGSVDGILDMFNFNASPGQLAQPIYLNAQTGEPSYPVEGTISPASGPEGTTVTINGLNLSTVTGQTQVYFGGRPALGVTCAASTTLNAPATTCTATAPKPFTAGEQVPVTVRVNGVAAVDDAGEYTYTS